MSNGTHKQFSENPSGDDGVCVLESVFLLFDYQKGK